MRRRQGRIDFIKVLMFAAAGAAVWATYAFAPPHWAEREMHNVVIITLFDWRDHNLNSAKKQLPKEMDAAEIPEYIWPEDCSFWEENDEKHLNCYWEVDVMYPLTDKLAKTLEFEVHHYVDARGNEFDWFGE